MKIIATGLDGLVGSRLVELLSSKHDFTNLSLSTGVNITNLDQVITACQNSKAPVMIHLAAFTDTKKAFAETGNKNGLAYKINVLGTKNIITACQQFNKRLIYISTDYVFDGRQSTPYTEEDQPNPIEWYGQTKFLGEQAVQKSNLTAIIARIAFPYRAHYSAKPDLLAKIIKGLNEKNLSPQFSDTKITPTFIDNIAYALDDLITNKETGIWHLVGSSNLSNYEFSRTVAEVFGFDQNLVKAGSLEDYLAQNNDIPYHKQLSLSNKKITDKFGNVMSTLKEGLEKVKLQLKNR